MEKIKWSLYNSEDFQNFCNSLLSFEISKKFVPFSAPGKDGGTDGSFVGSYDDNSGKWRFQYKFHGTARKTSFTAFKRDVINELENITDEDFLVMLTNTEILPQELQALEGLVGEKLNEKGLSTKVMIWDGAKIFTLYLRYPILETWLTSNFRSVQLQEFKDYFGSALHMEGFDPATQNNRFIARSEQFETLNDFLNSAQQHVAYITGEAGIGKSRLVIEFFKRYVEPDDHWQALVLANYTIAFDLLAKALNSAKNCVLLIEDAHEYTPQQIEELKQLVKSQRINRLKLIFTFRKIEFVDATRLTKNLNSPDLLSLDVGQLSEEDTKTLFTEELKHTYLINYIPQLMEISRGRPILIVALLNATSQQKFVPQAKTDQFLKDYVSRYFDSFIAYISQKTSLSQLKIKNFLYVVCLLEPIPIQDERWVKHLCETEQMQPDDVRFIFEQLSEQHFFSGKYQKELKPDYYSDIFLAGANVPWLSQKVQIYEDYLPNIIKNLATVEETEADPAQKSDSLLDNVLNSLLEKIKPGCSYTEFKSICKTIDSLGGYKPLHAKSLVTYYYRLLLETGSYLHTELNGVRTTKHYSLYKDYQAIKSILQDLLNHTDHYAFVLKTVIDLRQLIPDDGLFREIFGFSYLDAVYQFKVKRQLYFVEHTAKDLSDANETITKFLIDSYKELLKLEFNNSSADRSGTTISIQRYYIPDLPSTNQLRLKIIETLSDFYFKTTSLVFKEHILDVLLDISREIRSVGREKNYYTSTADTFAVLAFMDIAAASLPVELHRKALNKLFWLKEYELGGQLNEMVVKIEKKIEPKNFTEQLIYALTIAEVALTDYNQMKVELLDRCRLLLNNYDPEEVADAMITIYSQSSEIPHHFHEFFDLLLLEYQIYLQPIYDYLWKRSQPVVMQLGAGLLKAMYFRYGNTGLYWQKIAELEQLGTFQAFNVIISIYSMKGDEAEVATKDVELLERIFNKRFPENNYSFAFALPVLLTADTTVAERLMTAFLKECAYRDAGYLFLFLFDKYTEQYHTAKKLLLEHSHRFPIEHQLKGALKKVIRRDGFETVNIYLHQRIDIQFANIATGKAWSEYEPVPYNENGVLINELPTDQKHTILNSTIDWYCAANLTVESARSGILLVEYLSAFNAINEEIAGHIKKHYLDKDISKRHFVAIAECLQNFHYKNELLIDSIMHLYNNAVTRFSDDEEFLREIYYNCYQAIIEVGGKHGTAGEPFPQDIALKELLDTVISKYEGVAGLRVLNSALSHLNDQINDKDGRHDNDW